MLGEHRRREVTTKRSWSFFRSVFLLVWVKRSEVLCLFALLPNSHLCREPLQSWWKWRGTAVNAITCTHIWIDTYRRPICEPHVTITITSMVSGSKHENDERGRWFFILITVKTHMKMQLLRNGPLIYISSIMLCAHKCTPWGVMDMW